MTDTEKGRTTKQKVIFDNSPAPTTPRVAAKRIKKGTPPNKSQQQASSDDDNNDVEVSDHDDDNDNTIVAPISPESSPSKADDNYKLMIDKTGRIRNVKPEVLPSFMKEGNGNNTNQFYSQQPGKIRKTITIDGRLVNTQDPSTVPNESTPSVSDLLAEKNREETLKAVRKENFTTKTVLLKEKENAKSPKSILKPNHQYHKKIQKIETMVMAPEGGTWEGKRF